MSPIRISTAFGVSLLTITLAAPLPRDTWSSFSTVLTQPIVAGSKELYVDDCRHIRVGGRVRISFATDEEEEGSVVGVECASASSSSSAAIAAAEQQQQQLAASAADCDISADAEELSDRCKQILQAALHVPGVADSYRAAAHSRGIAALSAASPKYQQQQQGALVPDSTGLPPAPNRRRIRGLAKLLGKVDEDAAAPGARARRHHPLRGRPLRPLCECHIARHRAHVGGGERVRMPYDPGRRVQRARIVRGGHRQLRVRGGELWPRVRACLGVRGRMQRARLVRGCRPLRVCLRLDGPLVQRGCLRQRLLRAWLVRWRDVRVPCGIRRRDVQRAHGVGVPRLVQWPRQLCAPPRSSFLLFIYSSSSLLFPLLTPPLFFTLSSHRRRRRQRRARLPLPLQVRWRLVHAGRDRLPIAPRLQLQWRLHEQPVDRRRHVRVL